MSRNQHYNRDGHRERHNARDFSEAGPSEFSQVLTTNALQLRTQEMAIPLSDTIDCFCIVGQLKKRSFMERDRGDQLVIFFRGRPKPTSKLLWVFCLEHCDWICACNENNKLLCWPCLLFNGTVTCWDLFSIHNINDAAMLQKKHESSPSHISALVNFFIFRTDIAPSVRNHFDLEKHNNIVSRNRFTISKFIHIICYLTQQKLSLYTEGISVGTDNFSELLYLFRRLDPVLNQLVEGLNSLFYTSPNFLNNLLESICDSVLVFIKNDLANANYITLMLEEMKSSSDLIKLASVLRYADIHGVVHERFVGFSEFPKDKMIIHHVNGLLENYIHGKKLTGVSFIGPNFLDMRNQCLLDQIKERHEEVTFIHSYSQNSLYTISKFIMNSDALSKLYFTNLMNISDVFSRSKYLCLKWRERINEEVSWVYDSDLVHTVCKYRNDIPSVLAHIEGIEVGSEDIVIKAKAIVNYMRTFEFKVFSFFFVGVFSIHVPIFALSINDACDVDQYLKNIDRFVKGMDNLISHFPVIWKNIMTDLISVDPMIKMLPDKSYDSLMNRYQEFFLRIKNIIVSKVRDLKFTHIKLLNLIALLEPKHFARFSNIFPMKLFNELKDTRYMKMFDMMKLKSELEVVYQHNSLRKDNIYEFLIHLRSSGLSSILSETSKLTEFIVTLPLGFALSSNYSASCRIRQFSEDLPPQSQHAAILSIERGFLKKLKEGGAFENHVIQDFSRKVPLIELDYIPNF